MTREEKNQEIADLVEILGASPVFYLANTESLNAQATGALRRECFKSGVKMRVVKNSLLKKALERIDGKDYSPLFPAMKGNTALMIAEVANVPARLITEFKKKNQDKPAFKAAFVQEECYVGADQLASLVAIKSKEELLGELVALLQSPAKNVVSALQGSAGHKVAGLVKALEERG